MSFCSDKELAALATALGSKSAASAFCEKLTTLNATATDTTVADGLADLAEGVNQQFLVWAGALVFVMHGGFAMLCAGAIRSKNTMNILLQTILDACVSAIAFYLVGYGFAYGWGDEPNRFIGSNLFGLARFKSQNPSATGTPGWTNWFFQWAFAATATTIPAGAVAERFNFNAYLAYSAFIPAFVYPVVVRWAWSNRGWMGAWRVRDPLFDYGYVDFAGSGVVHMVGGLSGLMGAIMVGPRLGRFDSNGNPVDMPGHSATLLVLGTVLLWFGWYGFNPGSVLLTTTATLGRVSSRAAVLTTISGATGGLTALLSAFFRHKAWDLPSVCNGTLVGFVTITGGCHVLEPWAAIIAGSTGAILFDAICALFLKLQIDDPLSAAPMHAGTGAWGLFLIGLLAKKEYLYEVYAKSDSYGLFYGGGGKLLACQVIGIICIAAWVCGLMGPFFYVLKVLGKLRISPEEEQAGLDVSKHGGSAYNYDHGLGKPDKPAFQA